jgi:hypothetical protein
MACLDMAPKVEFWHLGLHTTIGECKEQVQWEQLLPHPKVCEPLATHVVCDSEEAQADVLNARRKYVIHIALPLKDMRIIKVGNVHAHTFLLSEDHPSQVGEKAGGARSSQHPYLLHAILPTS